MNKPAMIWLYVKRRIPFAMTARRRLEILRSRLGSDADYRNAIWKERN